jgi:putative tryptophan/tyrosine transport system substrate-binding protein
MDRRGSRLSRRQFVVGAAGLGLVAGCGRWPIPSQSQQPPKVARVGYLGPGDASSPLYEAFRQALRELGYVEGENLVIEARWVQGQYERYSALAAELVRLQPDVIVSVNTLSTQILQQATSTIPIVFVGLSDPVGLGIIASLARPGGNLTGTSDLLVGLSGKRLEVLRETVPGAARVVALTNPTNAAAAVDWGATQDAARALGLDVRSVEVRGVDDLQGAFDSLARERPDALIMLADSILTVTNTPHLPDLVARSRLPTLHFQRADVDAGGLMSYGPSRTGLNRRTAYYVDRILKGAKPADLPVEQPMTFDFVVNLKTARELGITFPNEILLQVTEVIQ